MSVVLGARDAATGRRMMQYLDRASTQGGRVGAVEKPRLAVPQSNAFGGDGEYTGGFRLVDMSETVKEKDEDGNEVEKVIPKIKIEHDINPNGFSLSFLRICIGTGVAQIDYGDADKITEFELSDMSDFIEGGNNTFTVYAYLTTDGSSDGWKTIGVRPYINLSYQLPYDNALYAGFYYTNGVNKIPNNIIAQVAIAGFELNSDNTISDIFQFYKGGSTLYISDTKYNETSLATIAGHYHASVYAARLIDPYTNEASGKYVYVTLPEIAYGSDEIPIGTVINVRAAYAEVYEDWEVVDDNQ